MKIISLFSGAGGLDLGLIQSGHNVIWANDIDADCVGTYRINIGRHIEMAPIEEVSPEAIPHGDVLVGGFPCQGFSQANSRRFVSDSRNKLYLEFLRVLKAKHPKWFIAENVRGILSLAGGSAILRIENDFARAGYRVQKMLFNTADYGVPQTRWRVIITGTRKDLPTSMDYKYPLKTHARKPSKGMKHWLSIGEALKGVPEPDVSHSLLNHVYSKYKINHRNFTGHRETDPAKPSPTILARGNGKGGVCAIAHPNNLRRMSIREQAIIQTFPNDFEFSGKMNSCYRQIGNAVPVLFARKLGEMLYNADLG